MTRCRRASLLMVCLAALLVTSALSQTGDSGKKEDTVGAATDERPSTGSPVAVVATPILPPSYQPIIVFGASVVEDHSFGDAGSSENSLILQPTAAVDIPLGRFRVVLHSSPSFLYRSSGENSLRANGLIDPALGLDVNLTHRLTLNLAGGIESGSELTRLYASASQACDDACRDRQKVMMRPEGTPSSISNPSGTVVHSLTSSVFDGHALAAVSWQRSRRERAAFDVAHVYTSAASTSSNVTSGRATLNYDLTPLSTLVTYGQLHHHFSDTFECTSYGLGAGITKRISDLTTWSVEAGPEYASRGCTQRWTLHYSALLQQELTRGSGFYLGATRDQGAYYLGGNRWVDSVTVGISKRVSSSALLELQGNYLRSAGDNAARISYSGYLLAPKLRWKIDRNVNLSLVYSHFYRTETTSGTKLPSINRNWVSIVLTWQAAPVKL